MDKLDFYTVDLEYVQLLKNAEQEQRGFSRVPDMEYGDKRKPKFLCGIVLKVSDADYYVPVSSYKLQRPDNFIIKADNGIVTSSLRFNYMFPIPKELVAVRTIDNEPDRKYRALLSQELKYCIENQPAIQYLAERTYNRVLLGRDLGLVANSCDFRLLEQKCAEYIMSLPKSPLATLPTAPDHAPVPPNETPKEQLERLYKDEFPPIKHISAETASAMEELNKTRSTPITIKEIRAEHEALGKRFEQSQDKSIFIAFQRLDGIMDGLKRAEKTDREEQAKSHATEHPPKKLTELVDE